MQSKPVKQSEVPNIYIEVYKSISSYCCFKANHKKKVLY